MWKETAETSVTMPSPSHYRELQSSSVKLLLPILFNASVGQPLSKELYAGNCELESLNQRNKCFGKSSLKGIRSVSLN